MNTIAEQVATKIGANPNQMPAQIADELMVSEFDVVVNLPASMATLFPRAELDSLMAELPEWGPVTTIVSVAGSIFEVKAPFPRGKVGHGYYNLINKGEGLHGHLKMDNVANVMLVSKPFMGAESHSIQFFDEAGAIVFKIYLGRDRKRVLIPEQVLRFQQLHQAYGA
ncbi:heme utilization cystosolic carrier protein HutX [Ferrimonas lipolytica]|uniref:Heme utilization cystosolic carrier protein HutX n=1 Tax=Ferrimonas lipolytica TaxID=2724191 RepID=A0A6H1UCB2_9GAMM|nr:heme utilization cystosolic carrier protein HutX [Ferrimonas lipolytica]QIZ76220.1 heme utilization cystosolic carrier protein HutX [Ferrimonas lipolytica]